MREVIAVSHTPVWGWPGTSTNVPPRPSFFWNPIPGLIVATLIFAIDATSCTVSAREPHCLIGDLAAAVSPLTDGEPWLGFSDAGDSRRGFRSIGHAVGGQAGQQPGLRGWPGQRMRIASSTGLKRNEEREQSSIPPASKLKRRLLEAPHPVSSRRSWSSCHEAYGDRAPAIKKQRPIRAASHPSPIGSRTNQFSPGTALCWPSTVVVARRVPHAESVDNQGRNVISGPWRALPGNRACGSAPGGGSLGVANSPVVLDGPPVVARTNRDPENRLA